MFKWNLIKFAEAISPALSDIDLVSYVKNNFDHCYEEYFYAEMRKKVLLIEEIN